MNDVGTENEKVQSTTDTGHPPKRRVANAEAAYNIFDRLKKDSEQLAKQRAIIQGQQDGNPPFSKTDRARYGLTWLSNVNFRRARSIVRLNAASTWNMLTSVDSFIELTPVASKDDKPQIEPSVDHAGIIAEEFTTALRNCANFHYNLMLRLREMHSFGNGPVYWTDPWDWRSHAAKTANFLLPVRASSNPNENDFVMIRDEVNVRWLFDKIDDEEVALEEGWNIEQVRKAIVKAYKEGQQGTTSDRYQESDWESVQHRIKNLDDDSDTQFDGVRIVHILDAEADGQGEVTHSIIAENELPDRQKKREFLFDYERRFKRMNEAVHFMLFDVGDGNLRSVKGLAYELYPTDDISNRLTNAILDGVTMSSGLLVQTQDATDAERLGIVRFGPVTVLPENLKIQQSSFQPPIDRSLAALNLIYGIENNNSGVYKTTQEAPRSRETQRTAREVEIQAQNEARFESIQAAWYYVQYEGWLRETARRLMNPDYPETADGYSDHEAFVERCLARGVPEELIDLAKWTLRAKRAIGLGSPFMAQQLTQWLLGMLPVLDERGRRNAVRDAIQVRFGAEKVDRYSPLQSRDMIPTSEHTMATLENNDHREGQPTTVGVDETHVIHLAVHVPPVLQLMQAYRQNPGAVDLGRAVVYVQTVLKHIAQHVQYLAQDPTHKQVTEQYQQVLKQVSEWFNELARNYQRLQAEKQKRQAEQKKALEEAMSSRRSEEYEVEMAKVQSKHEVEMAKADSLNETRLAKLQGSLESMARKAAAEVAREQFKMMSEEQRKNAETTAEISRKQRGGSE